LSPYQGMSLSDKGGGTMEKLTCFSPLTRGCPFRTLKKKKLKKRKLVSVPLPGDVPFGRKKLSEILREDPFQSPYQGMSLSDSTLLLYPKIDDLQGKNSEPPPF